MISIIHQIRRDIKGMAALLTVLIMAAAIFVFSFGAIFFSLSDMEMGFDMRKSSEAFYAADGCAEEALRLLQYDVNYSGGTLNFQNFSCIIQIQNIGGNNRTVTVTGIVGDYRRKITAETVVVNSEITLSSWQEIGN